MLSTSQKSNNEVGRNFDHSTSCSFVRRWKSAVHDSLLPGLCKRRTQTLWMQCGLLIIVMSLVPSVGSVATGVAVSTPNLSLIGVYSTVAILTWDDRITDKISAYEMTVRTRRDSSAQMVYRLTGSTRAYTVRGLYADTEYQAFLVAFSTSDAMVTNTSDVITFRTLAATSVGYADVSGAAGEYIVVILVLFAWVGAVVLFLNKWRSIRILQPREPRYRHSPKNLEHIRVVKEANDSVIYRNYSETLTQTMLAREKKIMQRMHTMPNIKVETGSELMKSNKKKEEEGRTLDKTTEEECEAPSSTSPSPQPASRSGDDQVPSTSRYVTVASLTQVPVIVSGNTESSSTKM